MSDRRSSSRIGACLLALVMVVSTVGCETNVALRGQGISAMERGDLQTARQRFARAVERKPQDYRAQYHLGVVELELGNALAAELALERALELRPNDPELTPDILDHLAEAMYQRGRVDTLHSWLAGIADRYGKSRDYVRQGRYLAKTGDIDAAKVAYRKAMRFAEGREIEPYLEAADFFESIGDVPAAIEVLRQAYYYWPDYPGLGNRFRKFGVVPGPTVAAEPPPLIRND